MAELSGISPSGALADLARVNVRYLLERRYRGQLVAAVALPLPPRSLSISTPAAPLITYTLGGEPLRELAPLRARTITLSGSTGHTARAGYTRSGAITAGTGAELLREFRAFIEEYQAAAAAEPNTYSSQGASAAHELIFRALDEDYHARAEPQALTIERDAGYSHTAPAWTLALLAYGEPEPYARPFERYQATLESYTETIRAAAAAVAVIGQAAQGVTRLARLTLGPLESLRLITAGLEDTLGAVSSLADLPADALGRLEQSALATRQSLTRLSADLERFPSTTAQAWQALSAAILGADEAQTQAERAIALTGRPPRLETTTAPPLSAQEPTYESPQSGARAAVLIRLSEGETLEDIARRLYGAADRWPELADFNGWSSPSRTASGRPARAGDRILAPQPNPTADQATGPDPYRTDLRLSSSGDLVLTAAGDLATTGGAANIEQAVRLRTLTTQGELNHAPRYGLPALTGRRLTASTSGQLAAIVREQLLSDPRLERVSRLEATDRGDQLHLELELVASAGALLTPTLTI